MTPLASIRLILADYQDATHSHDFTRIADLSIDGCQASIWESATHRDLVIRGSDDGWDWLRNFQFMPGWTGLGDSGAVYHRGMIGDARIVWAWAKDRGITHVTGHSRGGGVAQIVGPSLGAQATTFAAPRVLVGRRNPPDARLVRNYWLPGDPVPWAVPGYRYVGDGVELEPVSGRWGLRHAAGHYQSALEAVAG